MADNTPVLIAIAIMASIVYLTRVSGYFAGLRLRHIAGILCLPHLREKDCELVTAEPRDGASSLSGSGADDVRGPNLALETTGDLL